MWGYMWFLKQPHASRALDLLIEERESIVIVPGYAAAYLYSYIYIITPPCYEPYCKQNGVDDSVLLFEKY